MLLDLGGGSVPRQVAYRFGNRGRRGGDSKNNRGEEDARRDGGNESRQKEEGESQRKGKKKPTARVELAAFRSLIVKV